MAAVSGTTVGQAVGVLQTAELLGSLPETEAAVRAGELSSGAGRSDHGCGDR